MWQIAFVLNISRYLYFNERKNECFFNHFTACSSALKKLGKTPGKDRFWK
ncbi:hypothetical protein BLGI_346 [Brevibacillus laterosporus GI-9]|nr:hypothetical protein BLGI_346 [Brevibacillus laterosporus GI-9]